MRDALCCICTTVRCISVCDSIDDAEVTAHFNFLRSILQIEKVTGTCFILKFQKCVIILQ